MRLAYYAAVARAVGVPEMWIEDAVQEIAIACWRRGDDGAGTVRSAAIDAARALGPRSRSGAPRQTRTITATDRASDGLDSLVDVLDFRRAWARLTPKMRNAILAPAQKPADWSHRYKARQRLRALMAA